MMWMICVLGVIPSNCREIPSCLSIGSEEYRQECVVERGKFEGCIQTRDYQVICVDKDIQRENK